MVKLFKPHSGKASRSGKRRQGSSKSASTSSLINVQTSEMTLHNQVRLHEHPNVFVKGALPGERIHARVLESGKKSATAVATNILSPSEARVQAHCHYALGHSDIKIQEHACGGCVLGFTEAETLLSLKQVALGNAMHRVFGEKYNEGVWSEPITSPLAYRRKIRLAIDARNPQDIKVGFRQVNGKRVLPIAQCAVCEPPLQAIIARLSQCVADWHWLKAIGHISVLNTHKGVAVGFHANATLSQSALAAIRTFGEADDVMVLVNHKGAGHLAHWQSEGSYGLLAQETWITPALFLHTIDDDLYPVTLEDFVQVNATVTSQMVQNTIAALSLETDDTVLDLFAGAGNFTLPIARRCAQVLAVEGVASVVEQAAQSAQRQGFANIEWQAGDLASPEGLQRITEFGANKMVLDPARAGAGFVLAECDLTSITKIVYVSCNPQTWLSDAKILDAKGFVLKRVQLLDMFRATHHTELLSVWERET